MKLSPLGPLFLAVAVGCRAPPAPTRQDGLSPPQTAMLARADSLYSAGQYDSALAIWEEALAAVRAGNDTVTEANLLTSIGLASRNLGDYESARRAGEAALALKQQLGLRDQLFRSYNALGLVAWDEGRLDAAIALYDSAAAAAVVVGDSLGVAKAASNRGLVQKDRGELLLAREGFVQLRDLSRQIGDTLLLGRALDNLAMIDFQTGNLLGAQASATEALVLSRAAGDVEGEENALGQLAAVWHERGEPQRTFAAIDSALAIAERHGLRRRVAENLKLNGDYHAAAGDYRRALGYYRRAQAANLELGLPEDEGNTLRDEARVYYALGHLDTADARTRRALAIHQAGTFRLAELRDWLVLAELTMNHGDAVAARQALDAAEAVSRAIGAPSATAEVALGAARVFDQAGDASEVLKALDAGREGLALLGEGQRWEPDALRARAYARQGQWSAAAAAGRRAVVAVERVRSGYGSGTLRTAFLSARAQVYADLVLALLRQGKHEEAFEVADAARGRALLEHLAVARHELEQGGETGRDLARAEEMLRRIDALTSQLRTMGDVPHNQRGTTELAMTRSLEERLTATRSEYETLLSRLGPGTGAALLGATMPGSRRIRQVLQPDEVLIEYLILSNQALAFVMTGAATRVVELPVEIGELTARVRLARELMATPAATGASVPVLRELHQLLIAPLDEVVSAGGVRRLLVVPHGPLAYLPFAALRGADGAPLVDRYSILMLPSASSLVPLRASPRRGNGTLAAGMAFAPLPDALPATGLEAREVRQATGGRAIVGRKATEAEVRGALASAEIVHLATHGILNPDNPMFSRLELAPGGRRQGEDDGRFEVHEVLGTTVRAGLVYLSGCETGKGSAWRTGFDRNEDYATLAQAFLYAGARNVVATLWRVNDPGAAAFARLFYAARPERDPVGALAAAQRAMLRLPGYEAPYYWGSYQVSGAGL